jgi:hypothetical protein
MMHSPDGNIDVKKWKVRGERDSLEANPKDEASDEWIELLVGLSKLFDGFDLR